jgi:hypothetical protein
LARLVEHAYQFFTYNREVKRFCKAQFKKAVVPKTVAMRGIVLFFKQFVEKSKLFIIIVSQNIFYQIVILI